MGNVAHRIQRQIVELQAPMRALAERLQDEISRMQPRSVLPILDRVCDEVNPEETLIRLDRVEVDLGELPAADFERVFCERLEVELRRTLGARIEAEEIQGRTLGQSPRMTSALELFVSFATCGSVPWWADTRAPRLLERNARLLLDEAAPMLADVLIELARDPAPLRRLTTAYDDAILAAFCALFVSGSNASILCALPSSLVRLAQAGRIRVVGPTAGLRYIAWENVLRAAIQSKPGSTGATWAGKARNGNVPAVVEDALIEMAASVRVSYGELLRAGIVEGMGILGTTSRGSDEATDHTDTTSRGSDEATDRADTTSRGSDEATNRADATSGGPGSEFNRPDATSGGCDEKNDRPDATSGGPEKAAVANASTKTAMVSRKARVSPHKATRSLDMRSLFGEPDELYVHDAGLCLLWPFIPTLFGHLGLLEERVFRDEPSRHRAVRLLAFIATGKLDTDEYLWCLPKILCGLDPETVLEPADPLTEREIESSAEVIAAAISNAPHLNDMSVEFFRHSFLLRDGILTSQDGAWLLRVQRETYDIILDQLPWAYDWVMLSTMGTPLRVEWR